MMLIMDGFIKNTGELSKSLRMTPGRKQEINEIPFYSELR